VNFFCESSDFCTKACGSTEARCYSVGGLSGVNASVVGSLGACSQSQCAEVEEEHAQLQQGIYLHTFYHSHTYRT